MATDAENELNMLVQYFFRFGAKGGRKGLTLQASRYRKWSARAVHVHLLVCLKDRALARMLKRSVPSDARRAALTQLWRLLIFFGGTKLV